MCILLKQSLVFLACFVQKLSKKNIWGSARFPLVKERVKNRKKLSYTCKYRGLSSGEISSNKKASNKIYEHFGKGRK